MPRPLGQITANTTGFRALWVDYPLDELKEARCVPSGGGYSQPMRFRKDSRRGPSASGAGSNVGGMTFPCLHRNFTNGQNTRAVALEPLACPSLTKGKYRFDYGGAAKTFPTKMYPRGRNFVPPGIHAGGLRYHGMSPQ